MIFVRAMFYPRCLEFCIGFLTRVALLVEFFIFKKGYTCLIDVFLYIIVF